MWSRQRGFLLDQLRRMSGGGAVYTSINTFLQPKVLQALLLYRIPDKVAPDSGHLEN